MITATQHLENYFESFSEFEKLAAGHDLPWLRKLRRDAFAHFCEVGFPTTHDEDWRFTNVSAIAQTPFQLAPNGRAWLSQQELEPYRVAGVACQLVFVNGRFARELSLLGKTARYGEGQEPWWRDFQQSRSDRTAPRPLP